MNFHCNNGGTCVDGLKGHHCVCLPGYTGPQCNGTYLNAQFFQLYSKFTKQPVKTFVSFSKFHFLNKVSKLFTKKKDYLTPQKINCFGLPKNF